MAIKTVAEISNAKIRAWVEECVKMCEPDNVVVCDGSAEEYDRLVQKCVDAGLATPLAKKPHSFLFRFVCRSFSILTTSTIFERSTIAPKGHW